MRKAYVAAAFRSRSTDMPGRAYGEIPDDGYKRFLQSIEAVLEDHGFGTCLPHRDEGQWGRVYYPPQEISHRCFSRIRESDLVVAIPGRSRGVHVELGYAAGLRKPIVLLLHKHERESTLIAGLPSLTTVLRYEFETPTELRGQLNSALRLLSQQQSVVNP